MFCRFIFVKMFPLKKFKGGRLSNILYTFFFLLFLSACAPIDVFEKNVAIPGFAWASDFKPEISFDVTDTTARYTIYLEGFVDDKIARHIKTKSPGEPGDLLCGWVSKYRET